MQHPEEGIIHAWLDGALTVEEGAALEAHVAGCVECSARVAEARGLVAASSRIVSALDHVPSGVVPKEKPSHAVWYRSVPFRAAASLAIVAGASLLLVRGNQKAALDRAMPAASIPASESVSAVFSQKEAAPVVPDNPAGAALSAPEQTKSGATADRRRAAVPQVAAAPPSANRASDEQDLAKTAARRKEAASQAAPLLSDVVVTGVATAPATGAATMEAAAPAKGLKLVRSDTTAGTTRTLYEVSAGLQVTLVENPLRGFSAGAARTQAKATQATSPVSPPAPPPAEIAAAPGGMAVNTINWLDKQGHPMSLTGPLSRAELERIRQLLPPDKR